MMEELKKNELTENELNETEMDSVAGGWYDLYDIVMEEHEAKERAKNQGGARAHGTGASGSW